MPVYRTIPRYEPKMPKKMPHMAKKISPEDITEQQRRLRRQYPQMYEEPQADKNYLAGLPPELRRDVLLKTVAKKLKKVYGG